MIILKLGEHIDGEFTKFLVIVKMKVFQSPWRSYNQKIHKEVRNMCTIGWNGIHHIKMQIIISREKTV